MDREAAHTALTWTKSTYSRENGCIEIGAAPGIAGVRDSKLGAKSAVLSFEPAKLNEFVRGVKDKRFER